MKLTLTPKILEKVNKRLSDVKPRSFQATINALTTCDSFSPRLNRSQAMSLIAQRKAAKKAKKRKSYNPYACDPAKVAAYQATRKDLY